MNNDDDVYSERTLRYGRNINFICFIALGMIWMNVDLTDANLFGAKTSELNIWRVLFVMLVYQFGIFLYLGWIDWVNWQQRFFHVRGNLNDKTKELDVSGNQLQFVHWYLPIFVLSPRITWLIKKFLHKGFLDIQKRDTNKNTHEGWVVSRNGQFNSGAGAFVIPETTLGQRRATYQRWLVVEFGFPFFVTLTVFAFLIAKMVTTPIDNTIHALLCFTKTLI